MALNPSPSEIFNAEVLFREDCSPDEFIDVIVGNRVYMPCLYVSGTGPQGARAGGKLARGRPGCKAAFPEEQEEPGAASTLASPVPWGLREACTPV